VKSLWASAASGYLSGLRNGDARRRGIRVFYYHGLVERRGDPLLDRNFSLISDFQEHIRLLRRFRIVSLAELADELSNKRQFKTATVLTFDDGYANNLVAAEILDAARIPWSLFIATGAIGPQGVTWPEELSLLILHGQAQGVDALEKIWPLTNRERRQETFRGILIRMKAMAATQRRATLNQIRQQFPAGESRRLLNEFPSLRMLTWDEVRQLASSETEICSHGVYHEIHHDRQPATLRREELQNSKTQIEKRLGRSCNFFAFPNGDFTASSAQEVSDAGFTLAFTTQQKTIVPGTNPFLLPRFDPNYFVSFQSFTRNFFWENGG
jgi:peptidoglycan/xylan/chitin deacetylase (PgdA/CDA1 family)